MPEKFLFTSSATSGLTSSDGPAHAAPFLNPENQSAGSDRPRLSRLWPLLLGGWIVLLIAAVGWTTLGITEPIDGDAIGFLPQILHFKQDGRLINEIYGPALPYAPEHDGRYIWHGILFPLLTAKLTPTASYDSMMRVIFAYEAVTLLALGFILVRIRPTSWLEAIAVLGAPAVVSSWQKGLFGRPEVLVMMWIAIGLVGFIHARNQLRPWVAGLVIGVVAATSPIPGILLGLIYSAYTALVRDWKSCLRVSSLAAAVSVSVFFIVCTFSPYTIAEWLHGTLRHAEESVIGYQRQSFIRAWLFKEDRPFVAVWAVGFVFVALLFAGRAKEDSKSWRWGFGLFSIIAIVLAAYTSPDTRNYNVAALAPLLLTCFHALAWKPVDGFTGWKKGLWLSAAILLSAGATVSLLRLSLLKTHAEHGLSREAGTAILDRLRKPNEKIAISYGLFVLCEDTRGISALSSENYSDRPTIQSDADVVIIQQINPYKPEPAQYQNYTLEQSYFISYVPTFLGVPLAKSPRAFNFAVYRKSPTDANRDVPTTAHPDNLVQ